MSMHCIGKHTYLYVRRIYTVGIIGFLFNMAKMVCLCVKLIAIALVLFVLCPGAVHGLKRNKTERTTRLHFYMHDVVFGPNATAIPVAAPSGNVSNGFGTVYVIDDALTIGPSPNSRLVGRAQGMYIADSVMEYNLMLVFTVVLQTGKHNGSTISIQGADRPDLPLREVSVVGGTGRFRFARGYAGIMTHSLDPTTAVLKFNVTVIH